MDVLIILLVIIMILAVAAFCVALYGKATDFSARNYERRLRVEKEYDTALIGSAKVLAVGKRAFIAKGVGRDNQIIYAEYPLDDNGTPVAAKVIDGTILDKHRLASQLVDDSITARGASGTKLLTADEWKALGHEHADHKEALEYLMPLGVIKIQGGKPGEQGTYVKRGDTLQTLLRDLSVYALPLATGQRIDKT